MASSSALATEQPATLAAAGPAPRCPRQPATFARHNVSWNDDYAWLRAENWQDVLREPDKLPTPIRTYLEAENAYAEATLAPTQALQAILLAELRGRIKEDDASVPEPEHGWEYYERYRHKNTARHEGDYALYCRRKLKGGVPGKEEILLDGDARARHLADPAKPAEENFYDVGCMATAPGQHKLAWSEDHTGSEFFTIYVRELPAPSAPTDATLASAQPLVQKTDGTMVWSADGQGFFYLRLTDNHQPEGVYYHTLGSRSGADACIYREANSGFFISLDESLDQRLLVIDCHDHATSETRVVDLRTPLAQPVVVVPRAEGIMYSVTHHPDFSARFTAAEGQASWQASGLSEPAGGLFILTNAPEKAGQPRAGDRRLVHVPLALLPLADWSATQPVIPHRPGRLIDDFSVRQRWLIWLETCEARPQLCILPLGRLAMALAAQPENQGAALPVPDLEPDIVAMPEPAYDLDFIETREFTTSTLRYQYTSLTTPPETWDLDLTSGTRTLMKRQEIPSGHTPADYVTERRWATAPDGAKVPISLVYRRGRASGGPLYLTGYGAYGYTRPARFSSMALSLLNRGWAFAIAHVRGGREMGEAWYQAGKLAHKENTFADFIACAEALVTSGLTADGKILAQGGSAGGMLMGAVANRARPGLLGGIIADVPFVDVVTTILDETLPLTPPEWPEWGDPVHDETAFVRLRRYSPYDNVVAQPYPPMLVQAGLTDPRVTYWEPAKWVAKLRSKKTDTNPLLLITNMGAGHGGASGRFDSLKEIARELAFALAVIS